MGVMFACFIKDGNSDTSKKSAKFTKQKLCE